LPDRERQYYAWEGRGMADSFSSSLQAPVNITSFLRISFSAKINNKSVMKKSKDISVEEKLYILSLAQLGIKNAEIALKLGRNIFSIQRAIKAQKGLTAIAPPPPPVKRPGCPMPRRLKAVIENKGQMTKH
jgi:hypothetical protein